MTESSPPSTSGRPGQGAEAPRPFRVLCVCEGNICRSPVAAALLQTALGPDVEVCSAGTGAVVGAPVAPQMRALLGDRAPDVDAFRARQLRPAQLRDADVVLTMTATQRGRAVSLAPATVRRTFTLRELARLLAEVDPGLLPSGTVAERFAAAVPAALARRRFVPDPGRDDVADPYGRDDRAFRRAFDEIDAAVGGLAAVLRTGAREGDAQGQSTAGSASRTPAVAQSDEGGTIDRAAASASS